MGSGTVGTGKSQGPPAGVFFKYKRLSKGESWVILGAVAIELFNEVMRL